MTPPSSRRMGEPNRTGQAQHPETELGAYLLAALAPDQEAALERHLLQCPLCQDRLIELSEVLPALGQVAIDDAIALIDDASPAAAWVARAPSASAAPAVSGASALSGLNAAPSPSGHTAASGPSAVDAASSPSAVRAASRSPAPSSASVPSVSSALGAVTAVSDSSAASGPSSASAESSRSAARDSASSPVRGRATSRALARWRVAAAAGGVAAAAAAAILVAVVVGSNDETAGQAAGPTASLSVAVGPVSLVRVFPYTGDDQVTVRAWNSSGGADVTVQCHNERTRPAVIDPDGATYELWAIRDDGVSYKVSSWKTVYGDDTFPGRLDFPVDRISSFELRSAGEVLSVV